MTTGERIKEKRKILGLSAEKLAEKINVSPATIYRWEKGDIEKVPAPFLEPLADALQTTPEYLMGWNSGREVIISTAPWDPEEMAWAEDEDIRIMARGMSKMSKESRAKLIQVARVMFQEDFDEEGKKKR